uniref:Uncharacterized protein n=1 Tax=Wuchereria bancrofti TaxID=6293 RepID=A0AAF5PL42_WUCBA
MMNIMDVQTQLWIWDHEITSFMVLNGINSQSNLRIIFSFYLWSFSFMYGVFFLELHLFMCMFVGIIKGIARRSRPPFDIKDQLYEAPLVDNVVFSCQFDFFCSLPQFITLFVKLFPFVLGASRIFINRDYASNVMIGSQKYFFGRKLLAFVFHLFNFFLQIYYLVVQKEIFIQCLPLHTVDALKQMFPLIFGSNEQRNA